MSDVDRDPVDAVAEFLHSDGPSLNADDAAIEILDALDRAGFVVLRKRSPRLPEEIPAYGDKVETAGIEPAQQSPRGFVVPICSCSHAVGDHASASAGLNVSIGRCFRCDCRKFEEAA